MGTKFTEMTSISSIATSDIMPIVDLSDTEDLNKSISIDDFDKRYLGINDAVDWTSADNDNSLKTSGQVSVGDGSTAAPGIAFKDHTNYGFYYSGGMQVSAANVNVATFTSAQLQFKKITKILHNGSVGSVSLMVSGTSGSVQTGLFSADSGNALGVAAAGVQPVEFSATKTEFKKPVMFPSYTTTDRDALTPAAGWVLFNSTTSVLQCYDGSTWKDMHA